MVSTEKILVIKLGALGDFVQALGPMAAIRRHHANAHITLLTTAPFKSFATQSPYFDEIWIDSRPRWYAFQKLFALRERLNRGGFNRVYDLQNNDRTNLYFKLLNKPKPEWVGVARGASHRNTSPERTARQAYYGHVQTLGLAGIQDIEIDPMDWLKPSSGLTLPHKPYILIVPGASPKHPQKRWPAACYGQFAKDMAAQSFTPVILGTKDDEEAAKIIQTHCPQSINLCGKTSLADIVPLARHASAAIGNDTGPMHMIAPTGCPTLVLFSGTSTPSRHAPIGPHVTTLQATDLEKLSSETVIKKYGAMLSAHRTVISDNLAVH